MICPNCETQNKEGIKFCTTCGTELPKTAPLSSASPQSAGDSKTKMLESTTAQRAKESDLVGQTLDRKYKIIAKIGAGGMGSVYKAKRIHIGDLVAIKVLHSDLVGDQMAIERFRREARAAARLKHPNAVGIHDFAVSSGGLVYIVMELVDGKSLAALIKNQDPLDPSFVAEILNKVCSALDEAHRQNIVHRDLKPDNILVTRARSGVDVKVLDFGIAKLRDLSPGSNTLTGKGTIVGTPLYMSPEQCMGEEIDRRSDIYSLGVVLYEMLTGVAPFDSPTPTATIVQHVTVAPRPLRQINRELSPGIEKAVMRALEKRREDRPQTAGELADEFTAGMKREAAVGSVKRIDRQINPLEVTRQTEPSAEQGTIHPSFATTAPAALMARSDEITIADTKKKNYGAIVIVSIAVLALLLAATFLLLRSRTAVSSQGDSGNTSVETAEDKSLTEDKPVAEDESPDNRVEPPPPPAAPEPPGGMVYVTGGEFIMGRDNGTQYEKPQHQATVDPFFIDIFEVSCEEYKRFIDETGHRPPPRWSQGNYPAGWARRPVTGIDWDDANAYAQWAGKRLPTEQEWEFAARGTDGRLYPWGNEWKAKAANADSSSHKHADTVGQHPAGPSPFGAYDMAGNVWEWTASDLGAYPGGTLPAQAQLEMKVVRGGSWVESRNAATATSRKGLPPREGDYSNVGFRCVTDVTRPPDSR
ncbi:MAG TPA: SUMF1/EgtB/PvdO family nonheme iron enzyme [Blastocatellia bacterium]|nr:SUMF1/EgtB/PvdO family nonheme iron enzyme [Blastocatellia bacterium]